MPKINQQTVISAPVRWPSIPEQREIIRRADLLFGLADSIESRFGNGQKMLERLTPALLAKAFRGELVPQEPADEPALDLLEKIRVSKAHGVQRAKQTKVRKGQI